ncbi:MAG: FAD-dependent oxidoreductase [Candidatus Altiarchaeota archaeon]|nr:FAD-dependent oxidoreductase [Candidatus Altiarchaeota archaeon]
MDVLKGEIASLVWQSPNTLYLNVKLEKPIELEVGKFVKLKYKEIERAYTICNQEKTNLLEIFIKLKEGGKMSEALKTAKVGDKMDVTGPFTEVEFKTNKILALGGGSGMAAFIALLRENEIKGDRKIVAFFSAKKLVEIGFLEELLNLKKSKVIITLTQEKVEGHEHGRINREMVEKYVDPSKYSVFACGPKPFTIACGDMLKEFKPHLMMW